MTSMVRRVIACAAVGALALTLSVAATAQDKDKKKDDKKEEKTPSISEIMKKGHQGTKSLLAGIKTQVKAGQWDEAQDGAKSLKAFGEALGKNKPSKGGEESWKKLTDEYKDNTKAVADAAEKKDAKDTNDALAKIGMSCKGCHSVHREMNR